MKVDNAIYPSKEQIKAVAASEDTGPLVMVNLLKFREKAAYADGRDADISGAEAYQRYAAPMKKIVEAAGGRFLFVGDIKTLFIGATDELWDVVALVEYPSPEVFVRIVTSPEVADIGVHRAAGLAGQLLIQTKQIPGSRQAP